MLLYSSPLEFTYGSDSEQYITLAKNLITKGTFSLDRRADVLADMIPYDETMETPTAWRVPGYPVFLIFTGIDITNTYIIQILLTIIMFFMLYKISMHLFGEKASLLFLGILCIWPVYVAFSTQIMAEALGYFLLTCTIYILIFKNTIPWLILAGTLSGFATLTRPSLLIILPFLGAYLFSKKSNIKPFLFLGIVVLCMAPWAIRNQIVFGTPTLSTQTGEGIYWGTLPFNEKLKSCGGIDPIEKPYYFSILNSSMSEKEQSYALLSKAFENIKSNPFGVFKTKINNLYITLHQPYMFNMLDTEAFDAYTSNIKYIGNYIRRGSIGYYLFKLGYLGLWMAIWFLGLLFIAMNIKNKRYWFIFFLAMFPIFGSFITFPLDRYFIPFFPFILMLACAFFSNYFFYFINLFKENMPLKKIDDHDDYWKKRYQSVDDADTKQAQILWKNNSFHEYESLLDIGCGNGALLYFMKEKKLDVEGIDISKFMIKKCKRKKLKVRNLDLSKKNTKLTKKYDYIVIMSVLEHVQNAEDIIQKSKNHFRKRMYISIPNLSFIPHKLRFLLGKFPITSIVYHVKEHIRFWTFHDFKYWAEKQGLKVIKYTSCDENLISTIFPKWFASNIIYVLEPQKVNSTQKIRSSIVEYLINRYYKQIK